MICPICIGTTIATYGIPIASGVVSGYVAARIVNSKKTTSGSVGVATRNKNKIEVTFRR